MAEHRLIKLGSGPTVKGRCSCDLWVWLGTYHGEKRRWTTIRAEFAKHVEQAANRCTPPFVGSWCRAPATTTRAGLLGPIPLCEAHADEWDAKQAGKPALRGRE